MAEAEAVWYAYQNQQLMLARMVSDMYFEYGYKDRSTGLTRENLDLLQQLEPIVEERVKARGDLNARFADEIASAPDLQTARESFKALSKQAILLFDNFATNESPPLSLERCGMVFGGVGAEWIQGSEQVKNPYFGVEMSSCGSILRRAGETTTSSAASEAGCDHGDGPAQSCEHGNWGSCCSK